MNQSFNDLIPSKNLFTLTGVDDLIPEISDDLLNFYYEFPYKQKLNGFIVEQRLFVVARTHYEVMLDSPNSPSKPDDLAFCIKLLEEAERYLLGYIRDHFVPQLQDPQKRDAIVQCLSMAKETPVIQDKLIEMIMSWSPDWEKLITPHKGLQFSMGKNVFELIGVSHEGKGHFRETIRVNVRVIDTLPESHPNYAPESPLLAKYAEAVMATHQFELGASKIIGHRLDVPGFKLFVNPSLVP